MAFFGDTQVGEQILRDWLWQAPLFRFLGSE